MIDDMLSGEQQAASSKPMLQNYKKFCNTARRFCRKLKFNTWNSIFWHKLSCTTNM
jgi:hypothetical protein